MDNRKIPQTVTPVNVESALLEVLGHEPRTYIDKACTLWSFKIVEGEFADRVLTGITTDSMHPKSKQRGWVETLMGICLRPGAEFDLDTTHGKRAIGKLVQKPGREAGKIFTNVADLLPVAGRAR